MAAKISARFGQLWAGSLLAVCFAWPPTHADAAMEQSIGLQLGGADIAMTDTKLNWTVSSDDGNLITGRMVITGKSVAMDLDGLPSTLSEFWIVNESQNVLGGNFMIDIHLEIDRNSQSISSAGGEIAILGRLYDRAANNFVPDGGPTLLTGDITAFGFIGTSTAGRATFEFVFTPTGGKLHDPEFQSGAYRFFPGTFGTLIHSSDLSDSNNQLIELKLSTFESGFHNSDGPGGDTGSTVIPEPSSLPILAGLLLMTVPWTQRLIRPRHRN